VKSFQTGKSWGPFVEACRSPELEKKAADFENAFLFNPIFAGSVGVSKFHRLVLAAVRGRRGTQDVCLRCSRTCKVVRASSGLPSSFVCLDVEVDK